VPGQADFAGGETQPGSRGAAAGHAYGPAARPGAWGAEVSALIDRAEIYAFEDWRKRIEALITKADTVVCVLSPDAVAAVRGWRPFGRDRKHLWP
jgi:hypothetical protein